jgi:hypothetical protein
MHTQSAVDYEFNECSQFVVHLSKERRIFVSATCHFTDLCVEPPPPAWGMTGPILKSKVNCHMHFMFGWQVQKENLLRSMKRKVDFWRTANFFSF